MPTRPGEPALQGTAAQPAVGVGLHLRVHLARLAVCCIRGDSYDNELAETINGLYKAELIHRRGPWKTKESVELATLQWVHWFNHIRLLGPIGYIPPAEAEENYYRQLANSRETSVST